MLLLLSSLGWFALVLASLAGTVFTCWLTLALARAAGGGPEASSAGPLALALIVSLGFPIALAFWRHQGDPRRAMTTLAWLPAVWNACGLLLASQLIPNVMGTALRSHGAWVAVEQLGDTHTGTRVLSALGHNTADWIDPPPEAAPVEPSGEAIEPLTLADGLEAITVPFSSEGNAILVDVEVSGPSATLTVPYLFDTGASFTTINTKTAREIGITVPENAPTLKFNTASGPREGQMVYLPRIKLRNVEIKGLLVSVCDGCVNERSVGLLGLNVMREFIVNIDFPNHIQLIPRPRTERPNRAYDINPTVELEVERPEVWLGRVRWIVQIQNRGSVPIHDVIPEVRFSDGQRLRGEAVPEIAPGATGESLVEGRATTKDHDTELGYVLSLVEAYW